MSETKITAKYMGAMVSPKKAATVLDLVRGRSLEEAKVILAFDTSKAAKMILKVVKSAEANAVNNNKMDKSKLKISEIWVSGGQNLKRMQPGAKGHADPRLRRTSHIYVSLVEGGKK
ncbi:50S ribosomal protein L22 [candidate division WWE3 bacterium]|uniref:Large ribosomal subunit protein uL22 n=1 Tax=candidate division WWE3 bacterium TaxID=2053526 RepID=A0A7X9E6S6_UNCKA|nr:50S ribosomal protein L22 [candidate division WWE3 bacterium]